MRGSGRRIFQSGGTDSGKIPRLEQVQCVREQKWDHYGQKIMEKIREVGGEVGEENRSWITQDSVSHGKKFQFYASPGTIAVSYKK